MVNALPDACMVKAVRLSTAHVSRDTARWLDGLGVVSAAGEPPAGSPILTCAATGYGWMVSAAPPGDGAQEGVPSDLAALRTLARDADASFLVFDRDDDVVEGLPAFDW